ncbi:uncharacterized protein LOC105189316 [Harpegnathos saltator]|uniref:Tubulin epsilon and delta complex protein 1 domain-containing protein n=1 Tax=Harpegnathos saltator TaxID=610380 RepID=E2C2U2_HARSA|nr:uncharacterized protein LOC105189316 [Harpegnathos saltator]XP_011149639.1 uncharacterized protein LOC105189316 [Harpegnathos saltator]EFN77777.1 hypothetical protein EAI_15008 [Harpegnathos saltator]
MPDTVAEALQLLCQCIQSLIHVKIEPDDLISAYHDNVDHEVKCKLWDTLSILSDYAARLRGYHDVTNDCHVSILLRFAILRYPAFEFYVPQDNGGNRVLLIALAWLLATEDVLTLIQRMKLTSTARLDSLDDILQTKSRAPLSISDELHKITHLNGKVNMNLREISELKREWSRLASQIGEVGVRRFRSKSASCQYLPDLKACEIALTKRIVLLDGKGSAEDQQKLREFNDAQELLKIHTKWLEIRHVFFDWMTDVIPEHTTKPYSSKMIKGELEYFASYLRHVIEGRCRYLEMFRKTLPFESRENTIDPPSRLKKSQGNNTEAQKCLNEITKFMIVEEDSLQECEKQLAAELKEILKRIPFVYSL